MRSDHHRYERLNQIIHKKNRFNIFICIAVMATFCIISEMINQYTVLPNYLYLSKSIICLLAITTSIVHYFTTRIKYERIVAELRENGFLFTTVIVSQIRSLEVKHGAS